MSLQTLNDNSGVLIVAFDGRLQVLLTGYDSLFASKSGLSTEESTEFICGSGTITLLTSATLLEFDTVIRASLSPSAVRSHLQVFPSSDMEIKYVSETSWDSLQKSGAALLTEDEDEVGAVSQ